MNLEREYKKQIKELEKELRTAKFAAKGGRASRTEARKIHDQLLQAKADLARLLHRSGELEEPQQGQLRWKDGRLVCECGRLLPEEVAVNFHIVYDEPQRRDEPDVRTDAQRVDDAFKYGEVAIDRLLDLDHARFFELVYAKAAARNLVAGPEEQPPIKIDISAIPKFRVPA